MDPNFITITMPETTMSVSIDFGPKLDPLWAMAGSFELVLRCNELLARIEIIESLLNNLAANHR